MLRSDRAQECRVRLNDEEHRRPDARMPSGHDICGLRLLSVPAGLTRLSLHIGGRRVMSWSHADQDLRTGLGGAFGADLRTGLGAAFGADLRTGLGAAFGADLRTGLGGAFGADLRTVGDLLATGLWPYSDGADPGVIPVSLSQYNYTDLVFEYAGLDFSRPGEPVAVAKVTRTVEVTTCVVEVPVIEVDVVPHPDLDAGPAEVAVVQKLAGLTASEFARLRDSHSATRGPSNLTHVRNVLRFQGGMAGLMWSF